MNSKTATWLSWAALALCGGAAMIMNGARLQYQNFNLYVFLCVFAGAALVVGFRWLNDRSQTDNDNQSTNDT